MAQCFGKYYINTISRKLTPQIPRNLYVMTFFNIKTIVSYDSLILRRLFSINSITIPDKISGQGRDEIARGGTKKSF